jgi:hypothetical protein
LPKGFVSSCSNLETVLFTERAKLIIKNTSFRLLDNLCGPF